MSTHKKILILSFVFSIISLIIFRSIFLNNIKIRNNSKMNEKENNIKLEQSIKKELEENGKLKINEYTKKSEEEFLKSLENE